MSWTPERIEQLHKLNDGRTAEEIGCALGISRNAVIGKLRRLGVSSRSNHANTGNFRAARRLRAQKRMSTKPPKPQPKAPAVIAPPKIQAEPLPPDRVWAPPPGSKPVAFAALTEVSCRWPIGLKTVSYCGCAKIPGKPYCATHAATAFRDITPRTEKGLQFRANIGPSFRSAAAAAQEFLKETV